MFLRQNASPGQPTAGHDDATEATIVEAPRLQRPAAAEAIARPQPTEPFRPSKPGAPAGGPAVAPAAAQPPADAAEDAGGKRLIVGDGIRLKGEITACDRLVVEGHVEVTLNETRTVEIRPSGRFIGSCEVEAAEISGVYEGDLTVRGRLTVRASGRLTGRVNYGEFELERGGRVAGELSFRDAGGSEDSKPAGGGGPSHGEDAA